jgi:hypothetical protein
LILLKPGREGIRQNVGKEIHERWGEPEPVGQIEKRSERRSSGRIVRTESTGGVIPSRRETRGYDSA